MNVILLRILVIIVMAFSVFWMCRGMIWVGRPLFIKDAQRDTAILVESFDIIEGDKIEKSKGDVFARLLAGRIREIEGILAQKPDLSLIRKNANGRQLYIMEGSVGGEAETKVIKAAPLSLARDLEFKVQGVDVAGMLGYFQNQLHAGPRMKGLVKIGADKQEVMITLEGTEAEKAGWILSGPDLEGLIEAISLQFVLDTRRAGNVQLGSLTPKQLASLVEGVGSYYQCLNKYDPDHLTAETRDRMRKSRRVLSELVAEKPPSALPYLYLASVEMLLNDKEVDEPLRLFGMAVTMSPDNAFAREQIARLEKARSTASAPAETHAGGATLDLIRGQEAFRLVKLPEATAAVGKLKSPRTVRVAILTTGIDSSEPAIGGRIVSARSFIAGNNNVADTLGYGTQMAGLILAAAPQAEIVNVKVISDDGAAWDSTILEGMNFAAAEKAQILFVPLGTPVRNAVYETMLEHLTREGILVVAPAGNEGKDAISYPAGFPGTLSVGASTNDGKRTTFSNYSDQVTVFAPGVDILTLLPGNKSSQQSGTTFSSAIATGVAALMLAANKDLPAAAVPQLIKDTAKEIAGVRVLDAGAALNAAVAWKP